MRPAKRAIEAFGWFGKTVKVQTGLTSFDLNPCLFADAGIGVNRAAIGFPGLKERVQSLAASWKPSRMLVEDSGAGTSLVQEMRRLVSVASAKFEAGQVLLPECAP